MIIALGFTCLAACTNNTSYDSTGRPVPDPKKETFSLSKLVRENKHIPDSTPYIVNIPAGMPHAFKNIADKTANLVVIFPTNIWKYDVLDYFPFKTDTTKPVSRFKKFRNSLAKK